MRIIGKTKEVINNDFLEIFSAEIISLTGGLIAGIFLVLIVDNFGLIPGLLILIPGFLEMRGNIGGSLSARLGNALHLHKIRGSIKKSRILKENIISVFLLVIFVSLVIGFLAYLVTLFFFHINFPKIIFISVFAAIISNIIEIPLVIITTLWLFRHKLDPNDIMGPYVTTIGDILSVFSLLFVIWWIV